MKVIGRFDEWVRSGPFNTVGLARYRIFFALSLLLTLPSYSWVGEYPGYLYNPPPGPFALLSSFPPEAILITIEVLVAISAGLLLVGVFVVPASISATVLMLLGNGFSYSLGKIDHDILRVITPLILAVAWSHELYRRRRPGVTKEASVQWQMRLLALCIGLAMFTAAAPKIYAGWLDPSTSASRGYLFTQFYVEGSQDLLAPLFVAMNWPFLWELLDWATVFVEAGLLVSVLSWRAFRIFLSIFAVFHASVFLMLNISFAGNVIVYAAFASWQYLPVPGVIRTGVAGAAEKIPYGLVVALGVLFGGGAWLLTSLFGTASPWLSPLLLIIGALVGAAYITLEVFRAARTLVSAIRSRVST